MIILLLPLLIGVVAGLRTFTAPVTISWAAHQDAVTILITIVIVMVAR